MRARFGDFELDLETRELRKRGIRIKLQDQPFQVLTALLERPREVVTRDELYHRMWPDGTYVDFDQSLNKAVNKLRDALTDSADRPRYIETLPRRGYRFIGLVEPVDKEPSGKIERVSVQKSSTRRVQASPDSESDTDSGRQNSRFSRRVVLVVLCSVGLTASLLAWLVLRHEGSSGELKLRRLTANSGDRPLLGAVISPDGKYLAWSDEIGLHITLIATNEAHLIPRSRGLEPDIALVPVAWFPDGTRLLVNSLRFDARGMKAAIWIVPILGGTATELRENAVAGPISPDGKVIPFLSGGTNLDREIWVMGARGEAARMVASPQQGCKEAGCILAAGFAGITNLHWSPHGSRLGDARLQRLEHTTERVIETRQINFTADKAASAAPIAAVSENVLLWTADFCWLPDGRIVYPVNEGSPDLTDSNLWAIKVDEQTGRPIGSPRQITRTAALSFDDFSVSADGKLLAFRNYSGHATVFLGRREAGGTKIESLRRFTLDEEYEQPFAWTPDAKALIFVSNRKGNFAIYKQGVDEDTPEQIVRTTDDGGDVRVSPDGVWILYTTYTTEKYGGHMMRVPLSGGVPEPVMETRHLINFSCARPPSTVCISAEATSDLEIFTAFDPTGGRGRELFRLPLQSGDELYAFSLAPDGNAIAVLHLGSGIGVSATNRIQIVSLTGQHIRDIDVTSPMPLATMDWDWDGKALLCGVESRKGSSLLRVDLAGRAQLLWTQKGGLGTWAIPSPDGRYVAILGSVLDRNVWMLENF
jgi:DNA-binding winged helix-turn-helix (wHTH) protein/Tol biopolymer transport system component